MEPAMPPFRLNSLPLPRALPCLHMLQLIASPLAAQSPPASSFATRPVLERQAVQPRAVAPPLASPTQPALKRGPGAANGAAQALNPQPLPPREGELQMIELQQQVSDRERAAALSSKLAREQAEARKKVIGNLGGGSAPAAPAAAVRSLKATRVAQAAAPVATEYAISAPASAWRKSTPPGATAPLRPPVAAGAVQVAPPVARPINSIASRAAVGETSGRRYADALKSCKEAGIAPEISRITVLRPGQQFTIDGVCLGERIGRVTLAGGPAAGTRVTFSAWTDSRITATLDRVHGARDGNVELALFTHDGQRAVPRMARFVAVRETVRVPSERWAPFGTMSWASSDFPRAPAGYVVPDVRWNTPRPQLPSRFTLRLPEGCELTAVGIEASGVHFTSDIAFEDTAAPNDAAIRVGMQAVDVTRIQPPPIDGLKHAPVLIQRGSYVIGTEALCPVGVKP
jgi:hypothetical protein